MVWYSHVFQNFPQFIVIDTVKGFGIVNQAEIDVFLELSCFFDDPTDLEIWSLVPLPFLKPAWTSGSSQLTYCWSLAWRILSITLLACEMSAIVQWFEHSLALPVFGSAYKEENLGRSATMRVRLPVYFHSSLIWLWLLIKNSSSGSAPPLNQCHILL